MSKTMTAIVFGGSRGIGRACVQVLAADGFGVGYTSVSGAPVSGTSEGTVRCYQADIREMADVRKVFEFTRRDFAGHIQCVVANAGINVPPAPLADFDPERFRQLVEANIVGAFNVLAEAARQVADGGSIIALSTSLVRRAAPGLGPYSATKAAVESLVRAMACELSARGVRVNAVAPGPVDTDLFRAGKSPEALARSAAMSPLGRVGRPEEIAQVVGFLASERASWVQGQVVQPNGGMV
ncbi:SDR family oxidoreductase [Hydrogenophaga sp. BPS33]|uniref:SDR family oxidoreductase n=1 Tax=Hydrogenophaga sp. BPS33 TaxID=2651974 RepID=UPI00131F595F|nr:SDR family oxidoreductase [Hydrogenophaga sp. BPS33]QHE84294.1 SDR family oxidoreductase [Hydrogenophaga sp. BPS33]